MKDFQGIEYDLNDFMEYANGKKIVIFGAGKYGIHIYRVLIDNGIDIFAICDNDEKKLYSLKDAYPVMNLQKLRRRIEEYYFIIAISKIEIIKVVKDQLMYCGVNPDKIVIPLPDIRTGYFDGLIMFDSEYCVQALKEQWSRARCRNMQIVDYFKTNDLFKLVVLEIEELRGWIDQDVLNSEIVIVKKIDSLEKFTEREDCDAVLVLDEANYEKIEEILMRRTEVPVISIWDVVRF